MQQDSFSVAKEKRAQFNPNPLSKIVVVLALDIIVIVHPLPDWVGLAIVLVLTLFCTLAGFFSMGLKACLFYLLLFMIPPIDGVMAYPALLKMFISFFLIVRIFYLPIFIGAYLVKTSDVGSILSSLDTIHAPKSISIPIAVMFRFFPSFHEERRNIKLAMKVRGISFKNPIAYVEHVAVPLLIMCSTIADDIAKAAEVKCIENPTPSIRYTEVKFQLIDAVFVGIMGALLVGGLTWLK
ncbi:MAG: energy-coupling factor transporter transmembrane component T [Atopobium sp.]|uniref:energy-coupling factor transporter transmembrane component T n=1 Tax=Atopobium sp. TaxID=1872650 RepID=UPI002A8027E3|nr:energy-coupling factor transporter transmembrane component T [Atopobium sp.]MDY4523158.1 energy-coupling factor transporter transmembrane component T [Atopobium sp.]